MFANDFTRNSQTCPLLVHTPLCCTEYRILCRSAASVLLKCNSNSLIETLSYNHHQRAIEIRVNRPICYCEHEANSKVLCSMCAANFFPRLCWIRSHVYPTHTRTQTSDISVFVFLLALSSLISVSAGVRPSFTRDTSFIRKASAQVDHAARANIPKDICSVRSSATS